MARRKIMTDEDPVLRKKAKDVTVFDEKLHTLLDDMWETMKIENGAGLAAPQVGILRRVAVVEAAKGRKWELINPEIVSEEGEQEGIEGCLSFPNIWGIVTRPEKVIVQAKNRHGQSIVIAGEGFEARTFCHEIDHLSGRVFIDKVSRFIPPEELEKEVETRREMAAKKEPNA